MGSRHDNQLSDERVLVIFQKNKNIEQRVVAKNLSSRGSPKDKEAWIDFREHWYKDGPTEEPVHTRKGTMIRRNHLPKLIVALITELRADEIEGDHGEFSRMVRTQIAKLEGKI